jgi:DNA-binding IclR family transcriptional regulator
VSVQSLDRAFDILELLAREQQPLALSDISRDLDLHKSTVYRLLDSLKKRGYIEKSDTTNLYRLGVGFIELSSHYLNKVEIKTEAEPFLRQLSQILERTVYLAIMQDNEVAYVDKYEQFDSLRKYSIIGQRRPLYCTSLGKALLFSRTDAEIREVFKDIKLKRYTDNTITKITDLIAEIERSRKRGFSRDNQEMAEGEQCIGAPIYDYRNEVIAAISVAWNGEFTSVDEKKAASLTTKTAREISVRLGYLPDSPSQR